MDTGAPPDSILIPTAAVLLVERGQAVLLDADGVIERLSLKEAAERAHAAPPIVCHAKATSRALATTPFAAYDLLELFAFVRPAKFCVPTPRGLARALGLPTPDDSEEAATMLLDATRVLLADLRFADPQAAAIATTMTRAQWPWGPAVLAALGRNEASQRAGHLSEPLRVWQRLNEWMETPPPPPPTHQPVSGDEVRKRLADLLSEGAEKRPQQVDYALAAAAAFQPVDAAGEPRIVVAEAGTGVGKTLATWRPRAGGPTRTKARSGSRPIPVTCSASWTASSTGFIPTRPRRHCAPSCARGARIISAC